MQRLHRLLLTLLSFSSLSSHLTALLELQDHIWHFGHREPFIHPSLLPAVFISVWNRHEQNNWNIKSHKVCRYQLASETQGQIRFTSSRSLQIFSNPTFLRFTDAQASGTGIWLLDYWEAKKLQVRGAPERLCEELFVGVSWALLVWLTVKLIKSGNPLLRSILELPHRLSWMLSVENRENSREKSEAQVQILRDLFTFFSVALIVFFFCIFWLIWLLDIL